MMLVERSQYKRDILGVVEVKKATVRRLNEMGPCEWVDEGMEPTPFDLFADRYLKETSPVDKKEYTVSRLSRKGERKDVVRKIGVLRLGVFVPIESYGLLQTGESQI